MSHLRVAIAILLAASARAALASPEIPGAPQETPIALVGATVCPVSAPPIQNATLVFDQGRVTALGRRVEIPAGAKRIDVRGRRVYPGLINAYSQLGLVEIGAVRATRDYAETGTVNPNVRAETAFNPDSELIPVTRSGGVLLSLTAPSGGLISGTSALVQLDGWTWEEMTLQAPVGMHVQWPRMSPAADWKKSESGPSQEEQAKTRDDALALLEGTFADARSYRKARAAQGPDVGRHAIDSRWEAMLPVLEGKLPLVVAADEIQQIQAAVAFAQRAEVKLILYGGYDAPHCAALLEKHRVPVIVSTVHRLPLRRDDAYDAAYSLPERLRAAGVPFCLASQNTSNARNLPCEAGMAVAYGLPADEALRAITLYPAQILGLADRVGSLEVGRDATLIVTDGDVLDTPTHVEAAYIQGRAVDLDNRHERLWRKYQEKHRRLERTRR
ncbi:MAG TPA: amidohydrolase family protein [Thermoguttaceae bacterium]|nr:amidohydrolase family protein [Thermoguttaceae bacterium]